MSRTRKGPAAPKKAPSGPRLGTVTCALGKPFDDVVRDVIAPELLKIAEINRVDTPRLTPKQVLQYMKVTPASPLWKLMPSERRAVEMAYVEVCRQFIRSVRIVTAHVPSVQGEALFVNVADVPVFRDESGRERRGRTNVLADDARKSFDLSARVAACRYELVLRAFRQLEFWCSTSKVPEHYLEFVTRMRAEVERLETARAELRVAAAE